MKGLYQNMFAMLKTIDDCLEKRRLMPALVLLYSAIDAVASLERQPEERTRDSFLRWVEVYMLKALPLPCTALELYAARCGMVHSFAAESDLFRKGQVRCIVYAWGTARAEDLQKAADILHKTDSVSVHVADVINAFRNGLATYLDEVSTDKPREDRIAKQAGVWLINMEKEPIQALLDLHNKLKGADNLPGPTPE